MAGEDSTSTRGGKVRAGLPSACTAARMDTRERANSHAHAHHHVHTYIHTHTCTYRHTHSTHTQPKAPKEQNAHTQPEAHAAQDKPTHTPTSISPEQRWMRRRLTDTHHAYKTRNESTHMRGGQGDKGGGEGEPRIALSEHRALPRKDIGPHGRRRHCSCRGSPPNPNGESPRAGVRSVCRASSDSTRLETSHAKRCKVGASGARMGGPGGAPHSTFTCTTGEPRTEGSGGDGDAQEAEHGWVRIRIAVP